MRIIVLIELKHIIVTGGAEVVNVLTKHTESHDTKRTGNKNKNNHDSMMDEYNVNTRPKE